MKISWTLCALAILKIGEALLEVKMIDSKITDDFVGMVAKKMVSILQK